MANELTVIDTTKYTLVNTEQGRLQNAIAANLGGETISPTDLDRAKVPTGGGTSWTIPGVSGDETTKEIVGVIVFSKMVKAYWPEAGSNNPPQCSSKDGRIGIGDPGGDCATCPFSQWGSKQGSKGKACKDSRLLFIMRPEDALPLVVSVPPSSLNAVKKYLLRLTAKWLPFHAVMTRLSLEIDKTAEGVKYSKIVPSAAGVLTPEHAEKFFEFGQSLRSIFDAVEAEHAVDADAA